MSIHRSLKKRGSGKSSRNVLTRDERIVKLKEMDKFGEEASPYGLPKVRIYRVVAKKKVKKAEE